MRFERAKAFDGLLDLTLLRGRCLFHFVAPFRSRYVALQAGLLAMPRKPAHGVRRPSRACPLTASRRGRKEPGTAPLWRGRGRELCASARVRCARVGSRGSGSCSSTAFSRFLSCMAVRQAFMPQCHVQHAHAAASRQAFGISWAEMDPWKDRGAAAYRTKTVEAAQKKKGL